MSGDIQKQIDELSESIEDLEISPSGVTNYLGGETFSSYKEVWELTEKDIDDRIEELNEKIIEASGYLKVLDNAIRFHRH